jgi:hypothetical protein
MLRGELKIKGNVYEISGSGRGNYENNLLFFVM